MVDVLIDVQFGDCGKGKISKYLNKNDKYDIVAKYNGGGNAGHAVWIADKKFTAHYLTSAVYSKESVIVIGPGCVLNPKEFLSELNTFENAGFKVVHRTFIHPFCHIIEQEHIDKDDPDNKIGSTKKGIGPCYSGKYARTNRRAEDIPELENYVLTKKMLNDYKYDDVLMEGSQGWWLDIDWGNYPYVTSSHIHPAFAFATFGIPMDRLGIVYGVFKPYETYVGSSDSIVHASEEHAFAIRSIGHEYGETTGRPRKIGYLNINRLLKAIQQTGVTELFINKCDVLDEGRIFTLFDKDDNLKSFSNIMSMLYYIRGELMLNTNVKNLYCGFSKLNDDYIQLK